MTSIAIVETCWETWSSWPVCVQVVDRKQEEWDRVIDAVGDVDSVGGRRLLRRDRESEGRQRDMREEAW